MRRKYFETLSRPTRYVCFSLSKKNTSAILSITLETLAPVATSNDDYDILHQIDYHDIPRGEGLLRPDIDLLPAHAIERTTEAENPDIVQRLEPVSASGYPRFVLVEHRGVREGGV